MWANEGRSIKSASAENRPHSLSLLFINPEDKLKKAKNALSNSGTVETPDDEVTYRCYLLEPINISDFYGLDPPWPCANRYFLGPYIYRVNAEKGLRSIHIICPVVDDVMTGAAYSVNQMLPLLPDWNPTSHPPYA